MSVMKQIMEGMMPVMMKGVSSEEKQEMMLKMMPMMMADIDMTEMMAAMLTELLPKISEFRSQDDAGEKMLDRMASVMPNMCELIDKKALAEKKDAMVSKLMEREGFRERMPKCFPRECL